MSNQERIAVQFNGLDRWCKVTLANLWAIEEESGVSVIFPIGEKQLATLPPMTQNLYLIWALMRSGYPQATKQDAMEVMRETIKNRRFEKEIQPFLTTQYQGIVQSFTEDLAPSENPTEETAEKQLGDDLKPVAA